MDALAKHVKDLYGENAIVVNAQFEHLSSHNSELHHARMVRMTGDLYECVTPVEFKKLKLPA